MPVAFSFRAFACVALFALGAMPCAAAELTATEARWLQGARPVLRFAHEAGLPLDVVVQPQPTPGAAPLALAFVDGRCKLVLSMRGNDEAQATLDRVAPELLDPTLELMAAHELGHCRRYLDGAWEGLPAGFVARVPEGLDADVSAAYAGMQALRREEAYGDLVGLAWTAQRHPELYARLHDWLFAERAKDVVPGSPHDTLAWLARVPEAGAFTRASIFAASADCWISGLDAGP